MLTEVNNRVESDCSAFFETSIKRTTTAEQAHSSQLLRRVHVGAFVETVWKASQEDEVLLSSLSD
jgi:hypothetical protein